MRAAFRGGFFVGFSRRKRPVKRPLRISTNTASHGLEIRISVPTEQMRILRTSRRKSCRVPSPEAKFSRNVRYASLYAFNDGFYPSFQPYFSFAFLPCAFLILLPKYGKRAPFRTRVRMTAIFLILPKSYLRECWTCCRSS